MFCLRQVSYLEIHCSNVQFTSRVKNYFTVDSSERLNISVQFDIKFERCGVSQNQADFIQLTSMFIIDAYYVQPPHFGCSAEAQAQRINDNNNENDECDRVKGTCESRQNARGFVSGFLQLHKSKKIRFLFQYLVCRCCCSGKLERRFQRVNSGPPERSSHFSKIKTITTRETREHSMEKKNSALSIQITVGSKPGKINFAMGALQNVC